MTVKRYNFLSNGWTTPPSPLLSCSGEYVKYDDYAELHAKLDSLNDSYKEKYYDILDLVHKLEKNQTADLAVAAEANMRLLAKIQELESETIWDKLLK